MLSSSILVLNAHTSSPNATKRITEKGGGYMGRIAPDEEVARISDTFRVSPRTSNLLGGKDRLMPLAAHALWHRASGAQRWKVAEESNSLRFLALLNWRFHKAKFNRIAMVFNKLFLLDISITTVENCM